MLLYIEGNLKICLHRQRNTVRLQSTKRKLEIAVNEKHEKFEINWLSCVTSDKAPFQK